MFSLMRGALGGWIAKIFLVLLVASFAVWGVSGSIFSGVGNAVITVGDTNVSLVEYRLAYDRQHSAIERQLGARIPREQADLFGVSRNTLNQLVSGALLDETARKFGLGLSDEKLAGLIGDDDAFRDATGQFSRLRLQQVLQSIGMPEEQYVASRKANAIRQQIIEATAEKPGLPDSYFDLISAYQAEKRVFDYLLVGPQAVDTLPEPADTDLRDYYDANLEAYRAPEYRKLVLVKLEASDIADEGAISDDDIKAYYEERKASFSSDEKRRIEQLIFTDRAKADEAAKALKDGKTFEEVLAGEGKTPEEAEIGLLAKSAIPDKNIADAAFTLALNATSEVIDGVFGPVILRVTEIKPGEVKPLDEVKGEIRKALAMERAADKIYETHDIMEDERAAGEPLARAAKVAGLQTRIVEAVDRNARQKDGTVINNLPQSRDLLREAFDTEVGVEADPVSLGSEGFVWYEVESIEPERQKPFEEVEDDITTHWKETETAKAVDALAETIRERIAAGEEINTVAAELLSVDGDGTSPQMKTSAALLRTDTSSDLGEEAVRAGFAGGHGAFAVANASEPGVKAVLRVSEILDGTKAPIAKSVRSQHNNALSDDIVAQIVARLREENDVSVNRQAIEAALARR